MRIGVIGINHKLADIALREAIARACEKYFCSEKITHACHYFVLLSTCNRTEIYFSSHDPSMTHSYILHLLREEIQEDFDQKFYSFFGYDCFYHLARVAAGLDSAILAETEIQGQVRLCYENSAKRQQLPGELHFIFQKSLQIAKHTRNKFLGSFSQASIEHAMWQICRRHSHNNPHILFVGASQTNFKAIHYFKKRGFGNIHICNRTDEKARKAASELDLKYLPWQDLHVWKNLDVICCATKSPEPLIALDKEYLDKLFFDLSVPRNINSTPNLDNNLFHIDLLQRLARQKQEHMEASLAEADEHIAQATFSHIQGRQRREANKPQHLAYPRSYPKLVG